MFTTQLSPRLALLGTGEREMVRGGEANGNSARSHRLTSALALGIMALLGAQLMRQDKVLDKLDIVQQQVTTMTMQSLRADREMDKRVSKLEDHDDIKDVVRRAISDTHQQK